jgi:hypothetical protein
MHPPDPDPRRVRQLLESAACRVPVHLPAVGVAQDAAVDGPLDRAGDGRRRRDEHGLVAFAADLEHACTLGDLLAPGVPPEQ